MKLYYPLTHQLLNRMIHRVMRFVINHFTYNVARVNLTLLLRIACRSSNWFTHKLRVIVIGRHNLGQVNSFGPVLLCLYLEVRTDLLIPWHWIHNHYKVISFYRFSFLFILTNFFIWLGVLTIKIFLFNTLCPLFLKFIRRNFL